MQYIILKPEYSIKKKLEDEFVIINEKGEDIGKINYQTNELIERLNNRNTLDEICDYFVSNTSKSREYVKNNMAKVIQFLLANGILQEERN